MESEMTAQLPPMHERETSEHVPEASGILLLLMVMLVLVLLALLTI